MLDCQQLILLLLYNAISMYIADTYNSEDIKGKQIPILTNLEPKTIKGIESKGMILAVEIDGKAVLLEPDKKVNNGSKIQ